MDRIEGTELVVPARGSTPAGSRRRSLARRGWPAPRLLAAAPAPMPPAAAAAAAHRSGEGKAPRGGGPSSEGQGGSQRRLLAAHAAPVRARLVAAATPPRPSGAAARETPAAVREASSSGPEHGKRQRRPTAATPAVEMERNPIHASSPRFFQRNRLILNGFLMGKSSSNSP